MANTAPLHTRKVSMAKFRFTAGAGLLVLFMKMRKEPPELLSKAINSLGVRTRRHWHVPQKEECSGKGSSALVSHSSG
jgi:hypothetical protein